MWTFLTGLGWVLFAATYFIGFLYALTNSIVAYRNELLVPWRFEWRLLLWPLSALSGIADSRKTISSVLLRSSAILRQGPRR